MSDFKNPSVVYRENALNQFTAAIVERFEKGGKKCVLVEMLNGLIVNVAVNYASQDYVPKNAEIGDIIGFKTEDSSRYWELNGLSITSNQFDLYALVN